MNEIHYDINQFHWIKEANTFYAEAWNLVGIMPDGTIHPEPFPSAREQFVIKNYKTFGFRRFRYVDEVTEYYTQQIEDGAEIKFEVVNWIFESEDGIKCSVCIIP